MVNKAAMFLFFSWLAVIVICFGGSHVCLVSGKPTEGAWVWSAGGSHLGVSWNQEVSVTGNNTNHPQFIVCRRSEWMFLTRLQ